MDNNYKDFGFVNAEEERVFRNDTNSMDNNYYMVEFASGKTIHRMFFDVEEVKQHCFQHYPKDAIKTIYAEVYTGEEENV